MATNEQLSIEVAYAKPEEQVILTLTVAQDSTLHQAINLSGILQRFPEIDLEQQAIGVFSEPRQLQELVRAGDRIEIYRPLLSDPKEARRRKAKRKKTRA